MLCWCTKNNTNTYCFSRGKVDWNAIEKHCQTWHKKYDVPGMYLLQLLVLCFGILLNKNFRCIARSMWDCPRSARSFTHQIVYSQLVSAAVNVFSCIHFRLCRIGQVFTHLTVFSQLDTAALVSMPVYTHQKSSVCTHVRFQMEETVPWYVH